MSLARSTYYQRAESAAVSARRSRDAALLAVIEAVAAESPAYGYRRITHELRRRGTVVNHKRVARLMREGAVTPKRVRRFLATTDSAHDSPIFPNLAARLTVTGPNQLWVADLTYIRLRTRFVYLAVLLDAWSRKVVGYAISHLLDTRLPLAALEAALTHRRPPPGLVHHSDRGVQYASRAYREQLAAHGVRGSMSRSGNPYDNAYVESFMKTLKHEEIFARDYATMQDVRERLPRFLEDVYNRRRLHSALGYRPPEEFETLHTQPAA
jgi:putative transposase